VFLCRRAVCRRALRLGSWGRGRRLEAQQAELEEVVGFDLVRAAEQLFEVLVHVDEAAGQPVGAAVGELGDQAARLLQALGSPLHRLPLGKR
jgi:hypothetical protein